MIPVRLRFALTVRYYESSSPNEDSILERALARVVGSSPSVRTIHGTVHILEWKHLEHAKAQEVAGVLDRLGEGMVTVRLQGEEVPEEVSP